jgi:hypothetical protein
VRNADELRRQLADIRASAEARQIAIAVNVMTPEKNAFSVVSRNPMDKEVILHILSLWAMPKRTGAW